MRLAIITLGIFSLAMFAWASVDLAAMLQASPEKVGLILLAVIVGAAIGKVVKR